MGFMLLLDGAPAALVGARRWYLAPDIAALPADDPDRRRVRAVCVALTNAAWKDPSVLLRPRRQAP
jgi:hypothetical protein